MLNKIKGDIWSVHDAFVVIPTNLEGVCGRGLAKQMVGKYPLIGSHLRDCGRRGILSEQYFSENMFLEWFYPDPVDGDGLSPPVEVMYRRIVPFPVKRSWKDEADISMIATSAQRLVNTLSSNHPPDNPYLCLVPQVGCGFGELRPEVVMPVLEQILEPAGNRIVLILPDEGVFSRYPSSFKPGVRADRSAIEPNKI